MHPGQILIRDHPARFKVVACGRRYGKSLLGVFLGTDKALKGGTVWWVAPDFPTAMVGWNIILKLTDQIPGCRFNHSDYIAHLPGGGHIQVRSAGQTLRGQGLDFLVIDECADMPEHSWTEQLEPSLMDNLGSALFIGTPKGRNWFYHLWRDAAHEEGWAQFKAPSHANPFLSRKELTRLEKKHGGIKSRVWRQEYLAEFVTFEGRVYDNFDPGGPMVFDGELDLNKYHAFWGGIDFGFRNPCAFVVAGEDKEGRLDILEEVYEVGLGQADVISNIKRLTDKYKVRNWWADSADPQQIEDMTGAGLPVEASPRGAGGQESFVQYEIRIVSGRLNESPVGLRFHKPNTPICIKEHDEYRYSKQRAESMEKETPMKVNDHTCNAVHYLCHGLSEWYGNSNTGMMAEARDSYDL